MFYVYFHSYFLRAIKFNLLKLVRFNYTWAKVATMVYLEAPVGVGFSYSDDSSDYNTDDDQTAADNLAAVQGTLLLPITISIMQSTA
jgi:hypothetical protein